MAFIFLFNPQGHILKINGLDWIAGLIRANVLINYKDRGVLDFSHERLQLEWFLSCVVLLFVLE